MQLLRSRPDVSRWIAVLLCAISVAVCFAYAATRDQLPDWWRNYGGGVPYVVFWIMLGFVVFPFRKSVLAICWIAVLMTCGLEILQLWHPQWLDNIRATRFGAALLGSGFVWSDFPPYLIGGVLGYLILIAALKFMPYKPSSKDSLHADP